MSEELDFYDVDLCEIGNVCHLYGELLMKQPNGYVETIEDGVMYLLDNKDELAGIFRLLIEKYPKSNYLDDYKRLEKAIIEDFPTFEYIGQENFAVMIGEMFWKGKELRDDIFKSSEQIKAERENKNGK